MPGLACEDGVKWTLTLLFLRGNLLFTQVYLSKDVNDLFDGCPILVT
jgi:hypothetical protein